MITNLGDIQLKQTRILQGVGAKFSQNFAQHDKALGKPSRQRIGANLSEWRLQLKLHYLFCDPATVLEQLQTVLNNGLPVALVFDYLKYEGYVTLDDIDVTFSQTADNGRPLIIDANITLTEFSGDPTIKPPAPAVRDPSQSKPIQTAITDDVTTLLPSEQPLQQLERALIAQHRAKALLRTIKEVGHGDYNGLNMAISTTNQALHDIDEQQFLFALPTTLPAANSSNIDAVLGQMQSEQVLYATLARQGALRLWG